MAIEEIWPLTEMAVNSAHANTFDGLKFQLLRLPFELWYNKCMQPEKNYMDKLSMSAFAPLHNFISCFMLLLTP